MKTNPSLKIFKLSTLIAFGIALAAVLVTGPMHANEIIVLTEDSSGLTATYQGSSLGVTVTPNGADSWTVTFPSNVFFLTGSTRGWIEGTTEYNTVTGSSSNTLTVASDVSIIGLPPFPFLGDGQTFNDYGTDTSTIPNADIDVKFSDNGDASTSAVPDTGSTLGLLSLSVVALLGATRLRFLQLAA